MHYDSTAGFYTNSIDTYERPNQELDYSDFLKCFNEGNSIGFIDAPTISQALKWLREEKEIHIGVGHSGVTQWRYVIMYLNEAYFDNPNIMVKRFDSYEQAALAGIEYVLDNLI